MMIPARQRAVQFALEQAVVRRRRICGQHRSTLKGDIELQHGLGEVQPAARQRRRRRLAKQLDDDHHLAGDRPGQPLGDAVVMTLLENRGRNHLRQHQRRADD